MIARPPVAGPDPASFRVRAIAAATFDANAFGSVELACLPEGLQLVFLSIAGRSPGYAPRLPVSGTVVVPWGKVKRAHPDGAALRLEVERACTPFNRLTLVHLTTGASSPRDPFERRRRIRKIAWIFAPMASIAAVALARAVAPGIGLGALCAVALAASAVVVFVGSAMARDVALGGADGLDLRDALVAHLAAYGITTGPGAVLDARPRDEPPDDPPSTLVTALRGMRTTALGVAAFAIVALTAVGLGRALLDGALGEHDAKERQRDVDRAAGDEPPIAAAPSSSAWRPPPLPVEARAATGSTAPEPCRCPRADSPLWASGVPRLSLLVVPRGTSTIPGYVDLDVIAVNNGAAPVRDVDVAVQLYRRSRADDAKLEPHGRRGLFWGGELGSGQAGRWHLRVHADAVAPTTTVPGILGEDGIDPASADAFSALLGARTRAVQLHGATMLAYLRDSRAFGAVAKLARVEYQDEALLLDRLAGAAAPVYACATKAEPRDRALHVRACLVNGTAAPVSDIHARLVAHDVDDAAATHATAWTFVIPDAIPPGRGVVVAHDEPLDAPIDASRTWFELRVDGAAD